MQTISSQKKKKKSFVVYELTFYILIFKHVQKIKIYI